MVLKELGDKLRKQAAMLGAQPTISAAQWNQFLSAVAQILLKADVEFACVQRIQRSIRDSLEPPSMAPGARFTLTTSKIQQALVAALFKLLNVDPSSTTSTTTTTTATEPLWVHDLPPLLSHPRTRSFTTASDHSRGSSTKHTPAGHVWLLVGLQGAGKTTTCVKLAKYLRDRKKLTVGLVCADTFRAGAFDQLKQNATLAKIPFYGAYTERDPVAVASRGVEHFQTTDPKDLIIVDSAGRHKQDAALFEEMKLLTERVCPKHVALVMDASIGQSARQQVLAFHNAVRLHSIVLTKLDGNAKGGGAVSAVAATGVPISFIGTGEHLRDFDEFDAEAFISRLMGRGDIKGLMRQVRDSEVAFDLACLGGGGSDGAFTFALLKKQLEATMQMQAMGNVMEKLPGMDAILSQMKQPSAASAADHAMKTLRMMLVLIDSMTRQEVQWTHKTHRFTKEPSRVRRILRGSGCNDPSIFSRLLMTLETISKAMAGMRTMAAQHASGGAEPTPETTRGGKRVARKPNPKSAHSKLNRAPTGDRGNTTAAAGPATHVGNVRQKSHGNPQATRQVYGKTFDPQLLRAFGGVENVEKIMKEFEAAEKDMAAADSGGGGADLDGMTRRFESMGRSMGESMGRSMGQHSTAASGGAAVAAHEGRASNASRGNRTSL